MRSFVEMAMLGAVSTTEEFIIWIRDKPFYLPTPCSDLTLPWCCGKRSIFGGYAIPSISCVIWEKLFDMLEPHLSH